MDTKLVKPARTRRRRRHDSEFKAQVIEACMQPGVSIAAVALANGLNANFLRGWVKEHRDIVSASQTVKPKVVGTSVAGRMVPVTIQGPSIQDAGEIRIDIRREQTTVQIAWPTSQVAALGEWLKELLR